MRIALLLLSTVFLCIAGYLALKPDPWEAAQEKAEADARALAALASSPERIGWRLSEDTALLRVLLWDADGALRYPPPGAMTPLPFEFSKELTRRLTALQRQTNGSVWQTDQTEPGDLVHCRAEPAVCLVYARNTVEEALTLSSDALSGSQSSDRVAWALAILGGLVAIAGGLAQRQAFIPAHTLELLPDRHLAKRGALEIALTPRDLKLLALLQDRAGNVITKDELYDAGWGREYMPNSRALDQHMVNLRRKLDPDQSRPAVIETVHGVGYKLVG